MVLVHDANRSKVLLKLKWIRFWYFQFCGFYHCVSVLRKTRRISVEIRTNTGTWQHWRRETVAIDPRGGFPEDELLFVRSQRQRGSGAHIFQVGRGPQSPLASPFVPPSFSCSYSLSFSKCQKKKKTHLHNTQLRFPGKLRLCTWSGSRTDRIHNEHSVLVLFSVSKHLLSHVIDLHACTENEVKNHENKRLRSTIAILREDL